MMRRFIKKIFLFALLLLAIITGGLLFDRFYRDHNESDKIVLYGNVDVRQVDLGFRVYGRVNFMPFQEGDFVKKESLMATMDDQPYLDQKNQATAAVQATQVNLDNAQLLLKRRQELSKDGSISIEDLENATASRDALEANLKQAEATLSSANTNISDTKIYAPADGTILTRIREPGTIVNVGEPIYTLSLIDPVWVRAFIPEPYLGVVYPNMPAEVFTDTHNGKVYHGHVGFISPVAEFTPKSVETTQLRTDLVYRLRIIVDNPDWGLRQGMPVTVKLPLNSKTPNPQNPQGTDSE